MGGEDGCVSSFIKTTTQGLFFGTLVGGAESVWRTPPYGSPGAYSAWTDGVKNVRSRAFTIGAVAGAFSLGECTTNTMLCSDSHSPAGNLGGGVTAGVVLGLVQKSATRGLSGGVALGLVGALFDYFEHDVKDLGRVRDPLPGVADGATA